jgi:hypothetical protein
MRIVFVIIAAILLFPSCIAFYTPPVPHTPLIEKKGDVEIEAGILGGEGYHASLSYGVSDMLFAQAYATYDDYYQGAIGYYQTFNEGSKYINVFEFFPAIGYGIVRRNWDINELEGNYQIYTGQIVYGIIHDHFEAGVTLKTGLMNTDLEEENWSEYRGYYYIDHNNIIPLFEPGFFFRFGYKNVKINFQCVHTLYPYYEYVARGYHLNFSLGIAIDFNVLGSNQKTIQ